MWHKPCRTFHPWCVCIKTRCLYSCDVAPCHLASTQIVGTSDKESLNSLYSFVGGLFHGQYQHPSLGIRTAKQWLSTPGSEELDVVVVQYSVDLFVIYDKAGSRRLLVLLFFAMEIEDVKLMSLDQWMADASGTPTLCPCHGEMC